MDPKPSMQVCQQCGHDDDVELLAVDEVWTFICSNEGHPVYQWQPTAGNSGLLSGRSGLGEELGVYDDLLVCVKEGLAEYGVIEHRFAEYKPKTYDFLVRRYGHRALKPKRYTASAFLGSALGQLWREDAVEGVWVDATGYWSYNHRINAYGPPGTPEDSDVLTWATFAVETLGCKATDWPALRFVGPS